MNQSKEILIEHALEFAEAHKEEFDKYIQNIEESSNDDNLNIGDKVNLLLDANAESMKEIQQLKETLADFIHTSNLDRQDTNSKLAKISDILGIMDIPEVDFTEDEMDYSEIEKKSEARLITSSEIEKTLKPIDYSGQAKIINIFGSGSYGITTTALSFAYRLYPSSRVLFVDFDLTNPNADEYMQMMPVCYDIPGFPKNSLESTSLGILFDRGADTLKEYGKQLIKRKENSRNGCLDYMSGVYYRVDDNKLINFNYSYFFNYLSSAYDYIILDIGKYGSSVIKDTILKRFINIPGANTVAVTQCNKYRIRNFVNLLKGFKINPRELVFILNMCDTTILSETTKKILSGITYYIISDEALIKQTRSNFASISNRIVRSQFNLTLQSII